jgi:hypothetical protein
MYSFSSLRWVSLFSPSSSLDHSFLDFDPCFSNQVSVLCFSWSLCMRAFRDRVLDHRGRVVEIIPYFYYKRPLSSDHKW